MPVPDPMARYEKLVREQEAPLERFRGWGATDVEVDEVHNFLDWLGPVPARGPTRRDVIEYLWGWVPRKYVGAEDLIEETRLAIVRVLEFLASEGSNVAGALGVARDRVTFLRRLGTFDDGGPGWFEDLAEALEETGMEPFGELPDGFAWGGIQSPDEWKAADLLKERLTEAVHRGEIRPGEPDWRWASAAFQMRWLDTPHPVFEGRTPRTAVAAEREEQGHHLPELVASTRRMQELGMFRGLSFEGADVPAPTRAEPALRFPVVEIPNEDEAASAASASPTPARVRALVDLLGNGRPLTATGRLTLADAKALTEAIGVGDQFDPLIGDRVFKTVSSTQVLPVELAFRWARAAGLVKVVHRRISPTKRGHGLGRDPLDDWELLFDAFVWKLAWPRRRWPNDREPFWSGDLIELIPRLLEKLYAEGGEPLPLEDLTESLWLALAATYDTSWMTETQASYAPFWPAADIWHGIFEPLAELGVLELSGDEEYRESLGRRHEVPDPRAVRATPLGLRAIRRVIARRWGQTPPVAGDLAARAGSAETLLALASEFDLGPDELAAEARHYRGIRGSAAAQELAELLVRGGPNILAVVTCLNVLDAGELAPLVFAEAERVGSGGGALQCVAWLEEHGFEAPDVEATEEALAEATAWTVVAVARGDGVEAVPEILNTLGEREQVGSMETIGRLESALAVEALEAVAAGSSFASVRKAARKALHRHRTRGG